MKIIKNGTFGRSNFWWVNQQFRCNGCGCIFQMEEQDHSDNDPIFMIKCPCCNKLTRVSKPKPSVVSPTSTPTLDSIFGEVFGDGGLFENVFGKLPRK